jgi:predicted DNA-binding protein (UPF0251 family)
MSASDESSAKVTSQELLETAALRNMHRALMGEGDPWPSTRAGHDQKIREACEAWIKRLNDAVLVPLQSQLYEARDANDAATASQLRRKVKAVKWIAKQVRDYCDSPEFAVGADRLFKRLQGLSNVTPTEFYTMVIDEYFDTTLSNPEEFCGAKPTPITRNFEAFAAQIAKAFADQLKQTGSNSGAASKPRKRRCSRTLPSNRTITQKEAEAVMVVGECNGNKSEAARRLGKDRSTVQELYKSGLKKAGGALSNTKNSKKPSPLDPGKLNIGVSQENRPPRQRNRKSDAD